MIVPSSFNGYEIIEEISRTQFSLIRKVKQKSTNEIFAAKVYRKKDILRNFTLFGQNPLNLIYYNIDI